MSRSASMYMRPSSSIASQLGSHEWLMKRASFPCTAPSITVRDVTAKRNVWCRRWASSS
jgi:hypothetical protein